MVRRISGVNRLVSPSLSEELSEDEEEDACRLFFSFLRRLTLADLLGSSLLCFLLFLLFLLFFCDRFPTHACSCQHLFDVERVCVSPQTAIHAGCSLCGRVRSCRGTHSGELVSSGPAPPVSLLPTTYDRHRTQPRDRDHGFAVTLSSLSFRFRLV
jgi:hypothetical protein